MPWVKYLLSIFGCQHSKTTFPITTPGKKDTRIVCLDCGKEIPYSWKNMKRITKLSEKREQ